MKKLNILVIVMAFMGLFFGIFLVKQRFELIKKKEQIERDIAFLNPHQALVFWTTEKEGIAYIRYGESRFKRNQRAYQNNEDEESKLHVILLDAIPSDGFYITVHMKGKLSLFREIPIKIKYNPEEFENVEN